jgi:hypothetical protein
MTTPGQNHYLRRIKTISVTLPISPRALSGYPCAVLTQTYSKVEMAATAGHRQGKPAGEPTDRTVPRHRMTTACSSSTSRMSAICRSNAPGRFHGGVWPSPTSTDRPAHDPIPHLTSSCTSATRPDARAVRYERTPAAAATVDDANQHPGAARRGAAPSKASARAGEPWAPRVRRRWSYRCRFQPGRGFRPMRWGWNYSSDVPATARAGSAGK